MSTGRFRRTLGGAQRPEVGGGKRRLGVGICQFTTIRASFEEDVAAYRAAGADGIGICELKLAEGREDEQRRLVREAGLVATACVPAVPSILPLPLMPGPEEPERRVEAFKAGMRRLAPFEPTCIVCLTGPGGNEDRGTVAEGIRELAAEAGRLGLVLGLEPIQREFRDFWTIPTTLDEAAELAPPGVGLVFDTWHLWNAPGIDQQIARHADRITGVHVADWRDPTRNTNDRVLPGDGVAGVQALLRSLHEAGWRGPYELEIFSDDTLPDSLWRLPHTELARRGLAALESVLPA